MNVSFMYIRTYLNQCASHCYQHHHYKMKMYYNVKCNYSAVWYIVKKTVCDENVDYRIVEH